MLAPLQVYAVGMVALLSNEGLNILNEPVFVVWIAGSIEGTCLWKVCLTIILKAKSIITRPIINNGGFRCLITISYIIYLNCLVIL